MFKRIVICCDGSWNTPDQKDRGKVRPSNVAKLALAVAPKDDKGIPQLVFYDKGVGTGRYDRLIGGACGWGLSKNIEEAYRFLVDHYEPNDEIYLFGFSRGAYTARSVAGLIRNCGILKKEYAARFWQAYALYGRRDDASHPKKIEAQLFRKSYAHPQEEFRIKCIGVWDTVGALGIPLNCLYFLNKRWAFHDVQLSSWVDHAYQALAIDEKRKPFSPAIWQADKTNLIEKKQTLEQVWFAGSHTDIGGGYVDTGMSDITLHWMRDKAEGCGLGFNQNYFDKNTSPDFLGEIRDSTTGLFKLIPHYIRPIGLGDTGNKVSAESVHPSAIRRLMSRDLAYHPENLVAYNENRQSSANIAGYSTSGIQAAG